MTNSRHSRGNEHEDHRRLKAEGRTMLLTAGFDMVLCEYWYADVVGFRRTGAGLSAVAIEYERTVRNAIRNIRRNLANGCDFVFEVCMSLPVRAAAERLTVTKLTAYEQTKVRVLEISELTIDLLKSWNGGVAVDSRLIRVNS